MAGAWTIARTVAVVAQERTALLHPLWREWPGGVVGTKGAGRVVGHHTGASAIQLSIVPVGTPLPDVAGHVIEPIAVGRERLHRRRPLVAVLGSVLVRELALPEVGERLLVGWLVVAPGIGLAIQSTTGGELPLRLGRQTLAGPLRIGHGIVPGDVNNGMIVLAVEVAFGSFGMAPACAGRPVPPLGEVARVDGPRRWAEHQRGGHQFLLRWRGCPGR